MINKTLICWLFLCSFAFAADRIHVNVAVEQCDLIEHNYFYDDQERLVFVQYVFFDWSDDFNAYIIRAWRMAKGGTRSLRRGDKDDPPTIQEKEKWEAYIDSLNLPAEIANKAKYNGGNQNIYIWSSDPMYPRKNYNTNMYVMNWNDGDLSRQVSAPQFRTTYTLFDVELVNREILPKEKRRELIPASALLKKAAK